MAIATVKNPYAPIYERPTEESLRVDEALYGMSVQVTENTGAGWLHIRTEYHVQGYIHMDDLLTTPEIAASWRKYPKWVVLSPWADIQKAASTNSPVLTTIPRGSVLVVLGQPVSGWQKVGQIDGSVGYTRASYLGEVITDWNRLSPADMRWNLVETALSYNGASYRVGGRTPQGIDSVGLAAMSYYLNGVTIWRETYMKQGLALHSIQPELMDEGDLIYFPESIGIYMGNGKFVHATSFRGQEGVIVSSLEPQDEDYRQDLADHILGVGSLF